MRDCESERVRSGSQLSSDIQKFFSFGLDVVLPYHNFLNILFAIYMGAWWLFECTIYKVSHILKPLQRFGGKVTSVNTGGVYVKWQNPNTI